MSGGAHTEGDTKHPSILLLPQVLARTGLKKTSLYGLIKKGLFPEPRRLMANSRSVGWLEEEVDNYVAGLEVKQTASPKTPIKLAQETVSSPPLRTLRRAPAKPTKILDNHKGNQAASDDALIPIGLEIVGRPVFLHRKSGKVLLDIGHMSFPHTGNFHGAMAVDSD